MSDLPPNRQRRLSGPWIVVCVPMEDDPLYPSRRQFHNQKRGHGVETLKAATQFTDHKEAKRIANRIMARSPKTWADAVPFALAWALINSGGADWERGKREPRA